MAVALMDLALQLGRRCGERQDELRAELGLSSAELACLRVVPRQGGIACGELARAMGLSPSRCTRILDGLVQRRLVTRRPDGDDRRRNVVTATRKGVAIMGRIADQLAGCERALRQQLSGADQRRAVLGIRLLLEALDGGRERAGAR